MSTHVLACIDGSDYSASVCDYAGWASQQLSAPLVLLHVLNSPERSQLVDLSTSTSLDAQEKLLAELTELDKKRIGLAEQQAKLILEQARDRLVESGYPAPRILQHQGRLVETLEQYDDFCQLLVLGRQGTNQKVDRKRMGSHVEQLLRTTDKPVLLVPPIFQPPGKLMLAFDGSTTTRKGVEMLATSTLLQGLHCHLVIVNEDYQHQGQLEWAEQTLRNAGLDVTATRLEGDVEYNLRQYQREHGIELIVMGAYGHSRIRQWLVGSTTTAMIAGAAVPLLILR
ncbi:universal stress protein [Zobellella maritima]|uniref:universal stress protein n=1 Tax=Zobellella maritima TaxID=2059725 RepID=UPI000E30803E|nr:universal stress protein [Zobellella maritima]